MLRTQAAINQFKLWLLSEVNWRDLQAYVTKEVTQYIQFNDEPTTV
jgi:hypothetical protein